MIDWSGPSSNSLICKFHIVRYQGKCNKRHSDCTLFEINLLAQAWRLQFSMVKPYQLRLNTFVQMDIQTTYLCKCNLYGSRFQWYLLVATLKFNNRSQCHIPRWVRDIAIFKIFEQNLI